MSPLGAYLLAAGQHPWNWGDKPGPRRDCCRFAADWVVSLGYADPMAAFRDLYHDEASARELLAKQGLLRLVDRGLRGVGIGRTTDIKTGDIAVLNRMGPAGVDMVCAIRSGDRWVTLLERGLFVDEGGDVVRAYDVRYNG